MSSSIGRHSRDARPYQRRTPSAALARREARSINGLAIGRLFDFDGTCFEPMVT